MNSNNKVTTKHAWAHLFMPLMALLSTPLLAAEAVPKINLQGFANQPIYLVFTLVAISLLPFIGMMVTSFVKIAVVLSLTRQAIGVQQIPPTTAITGLSILLTLYVMYPVGVEIQQNSKHLIQYQNSTFFDKSNIDVLFQIAEKAKEPIKKFLVRQASEKNTQLFYNLGTQARSDQNQMAVSRQDLIVLVPAFVISELTEAFQIGFLIFLPFLIVDMAVSNILMALGMQMLSPTVISLPFKLLLFVMADGWHLIAKGLVLGYRP